MAASGYKVRLIERHSTVGGRARQLQAKGFRFDMGPSWYWMPDVIERYFARFGKLASEYFQLQRLDPSYRVFWEKDRYWDIPAGVEACAKLFEQIEPGSSDQLRRFLRKAKERYSIGMKKLVYKPAHSWTEYADVKLLWKMLRGSMLVSVRRHVAHYFKHPQLRMLMEFPVLFLGASPARTPSLYTLMNYADIELGTWYPIGGMYKLIEAMHTLAQEKGVEISYNCEATAISVSKARAQYVNCTEGKLETDVVVCGADYRHGERLLSEQWRSYRSSYWATRKMAPSALIYYIGLNRRVSGLVHHNLFFDASFEAHLSSIYEQPSWPSTPLFYACVPSKTDSSVAPRGHENIFLLVPIAAGLADNEQLRARYYELLLDRIEQHTGESIRPYVVYKHSYAGSDFERDYYAYKGNAYGLANTLRQTAVGKPSLRSRRVRNLFFCGQLTTPGPGVPPSIISGEVAALEAQKYYP